MQPLTAVVLGATGLIGEQLVQQLLKDPAFSKIRILVRRPVDFSHARLETRVVDFDNFVDFRRQLGHGDCIFCCIGTTNKKVKGDKAAYRKVDFDIPVNAARMGREAGFNTYLLVSAVGSNKQSRNFYIRLKGEVENEIETMGFPGLHVFKPSILFGDRKEFRLGEMFGKLVMRLLSNLMTGGLRKYRGIEGAVVAAAMITASKSTFRGTAFHYYDDMTKAVMQRE